MGKITGFLEIDRHDRKYAPVADRVKHYREFVIPLSEKDTRDQAARCMNCGIPYCHGTGSVAPGTPGCPVNNQIPDFNDLVYSGNWEEASRNLHSTNNFPEFTGRICPAPCEASCTLNIDDNPVTIKTIECAIVDRAWDNGWVTPEIPTTRTGKKVAVIGSGPAGPAAVRHPRFQDGEARHRPPGDADGSRGRHVSLRRPCRRHVSRCDRSARDAERI
jgi:glutamate synthase (NADPH/NADH) small chain